MMEFAQRDEAIEDIEVEVLRGEANAETLTLEEYLKSLWKGVELQYGETTILT
jgi:hypothetical protein